jgi:6-phosphogluconolactonase
MSLRFINVFRDLDALSESAADAFTESARQAIDQKGNFTVVLTGGDTVKRLHARFAFPEFKSKIAWENIRFFWGDERLVPPEHPESNYGQAQQLFLNRVGVRPENIFRIRGELAPEDAVRDYTEKLKENAAAGNEWPHFDLVFLGMGSDGHIASIFPGEISQDEQDSPVVATFAEYEGRPSQRVSLTPMVFNSAKEIIFLVSGDSKAAVLEKVIQGEGNEEQYPALRIHPKDGQVQWFVDEAAASLLPKDQF